MIENVQAERFCTIILRSNSSVGIMMEIYVPSASPNFLFFFPFHNRMRVSGHRLPPLFYVFYDRLNGFTPLNIFLFFEILETEEKLHGYLENSSCGGPTTALIMLKM